MKTNFIFGEPSYSLPVVDYNSTKETFENIAKGTNNYKIDNSCVSDCIDFIDWLLAEYKIYNC